MEIAVDMGNILSLANHDVRTNGVPELIKNQFVPPYGLSVILEDGGKEIRELMIEIDQTKREKESFYKETDAHIAGYEQLKKRFVGQKELLQAQLNVEEIELGYLEENKKSFTEICENRSLSIQKPETIIVEKRQKKQTKQVFAELAKSIGFFVLIEVIILTILYQFLRDTHSTVEVIIRSLGVLFLVILTKYFHGQYQKKGEKRLLYFTWFNAFLFLSSIAITLLVAFLDGNSAAPATGFSDTIEESNENILLQYANIFGLLPVLVAAISLFLFPLFLPKDGSKKKKKVKPSSLRPEQAEFNRLEMLVQEQQSKMEQTRRKMEAMEQQQYGEMKQFKRLSNNIKDKLNDISNLIEKKELDLSEMMIHKKIEVDSYKNCYAELLSKNPLKATVVQPFWPTEQDLINYYQKKNAHEPIT